MPDAFVGAEIYDHRIENAGTIVGVYERTIRDRDTGGMLDTEVHVDIDYEEYDDIVSVPLDVYKEDPDIEVVSIPSESQDV